MVIPVLLVCLGYYCCSPRYQALVVDEDAFRATSVIEASQSGRTGRHHLVHRGVFSTPSPNSRGGAIARPMRELPAFASAHLRSAAESLCLAASAKIATTPA